jgi:dienelactone hydrolase
MKMTVPASNVSVEKDSDVLPLPFDRYRTNDSLGREITFYLDRQSSAQTKLPIVVVLRGSGGGSVFRQSKDDGKIQVACIPAMDAMNKCVAGKARILLVEKPGVQYLGESEPGLSTGCSEEFLREHSLPRWAEAVNASIRSVHSLPFVDTAKTLVMGASEGGNVAAKVAATNPDVTHVASLYGGGPTQLFDLIEMARNGVSCDEALEGDPESRIQAVLDKWAEIQADPENSTKFYEGHTFLRWSSFTSESMIENLLHCSARIFVAHGSADTNTPISAFDVLVATLISKNRDVTFERIEGAAHGFYFKDSKGVNSHNVSDQLYERLIAWFLNSR